MIKLFQALQKWFSANFLFLGVFAILFLSFVFKVLTLPDLTIYGDEAFSVFYSQQSLKELMQRLMQDTNPPLYFIVLHYWIKFFGIHVVQVKGLSVFFSILTSIVVFDFSRKYLNKLSAVFFSVMFLFSDIHFDYAHQLRAFSMVLFFAALAIYLFFDIIYGKTNKVKWIVFGLVNFLLLFTHYITVFFIAALFISSLFYRKKHKEEFKLLFRGFLLTAALFLPWVIIVLNNVPKAGEFWLETAKFKDLKFAFEKLAEDASLEKVYFIFAFAAIPLLFLQRKVKIFSDKFKPNVLITLLICTFFPVLICYFISKYVPAFQFRYLLYSSICWVLLVGYMITSLNINIYFKALCLLPFFTYQIKHFYPQDRGVENWKETARLVRDLKDDNSLVVITASYKHVDFCYYYNPFYFQDYENTIKLLYEDKIVQANDAGGLENYDLQKYDRIILVQSHHLVVDKENTIEKKLDTEFQKCKKYGDDKTAKITLYTNKNLECGNFDETENYIADRKSCEIWNKTVKSSQIQQIKKTTFSCNMEGFGKCKRIWELTDEESLSSSNSVLVNKEYEYSLTLNEYVEGLMEVEVDLNVFIKERCNAYFVITLENTSRELAFREEYYFDNEIKQLRNWQTLSKKIKIPVDYWGAYQLKMYVWNANDCNVYLDDINYTLIQRIKD